MDSAPFSRIAIVGLGLIGGSIAKAAHRAWPAVHVVAIDRAPTLDAALAAGIVQERRSRVDELAGVDLVVLATPVPGIIELIADCADAGLTAVVTDVGSTKRGIMRAAEGRGLAFAGGHPIAGAAYGGFEHARADLFDGRPWLLVQGEAAGASALDRVDAFARGLGAAPARIDAETHDRVMAYVSHLPQLLSSALMRAAGSAVGTSGLALSGRGFADMTRLASSPADVWQGIFATNEDFIAEALHAFLRALPRIGGAGTDSHDADELFSQANDWLARMRP